MSQPRDLSLRLLLVKAVGRNWPLPRGRGLATRFLLAGFRKWPNYASFTFKYGTFADVSLLPWPKGFRELFIYGEMEGTELAVWKKVINAGDMVVDAGANFGYWSLVASTLVGETGCVVAFEPVPFIFSKLREHIELSKKGNIEALNVGLSDSEGTLEINLCLDDPIGGQSSAGKPKTLEWGESLICRKMRLEDTPALMLRSPRLIKIDVEGCELLVLKGAQRILSSKMPPVLTIEWNLVTAESMSFHPRDIINFLTQYGYEIFLATSNGLEPFHEKSDDYDWIPMIWAVHRKDILEHPDWFV